MSRHFSRGRFLAGGILTGLVCASLALQVAAQQKASPPDFSLNQVGWVTTGEITGVPGDRQRLRRPGRIVTGGGVRNHELRDPGPLAGCSLFVHVHTHAPRAARKHGKLIRFVDAAGHAPKLA